MLPPAYCLTLAQTPERTAKAQKRFEKAGIPVQFVNGIHGGALGILGGYPMHQRDDSTSVDRLKQLIKHRTGFTESHDGIREYLAAIDRKGYFLAPGKLALALGHLMIWEMARIQGYREFLVFEDDVILPDNFLEKYADARLELPSGWDLLYLEHCCCDDTPVSPGSVIAGERYPMCMAAYLVNQKAINTLIDSLYPLNAPIDILIRVRALPNLNHFVTTPKLCNQESASGIAPPVPCSLDYYSDISKYYI